MLKKEILELSEKEGRLNVYNKNAHKALRMRKGKLIALGVEFSPEPSNLDYIDTEIVDKTI